MLKKVFKIDNNIYSNESIMSAIEAFLDISSVSFLDWELFIQWENEIEIEIIFNEFMNYVLALENE